MVKVDLDSGKISGGGSGGSERDEAKLTSEKVKTLFWHFKIPRWRSRAEGQKGVWMRKSLE